MHPEPEPAPGSTGGAPRTASAPSAPAGPHAYYVQRCVLLVDWWLERVEGEEGKVRVAGIPHNPQMRHLLLPLLHFLILFSQLPTQMCFGCTSSYSANRKGASPSKGSRKGAGRVFRSAAIVKRHEATAIETEDGYLIRIGRLLNIPQMRENGFPQEVCEYFELGFPIQWRKLVNPNMEQQNEQARPQSESTANGPSHSVEYYMEKFLSDSATNSMIYAFTEYDFYSSAEYTSNRDGPATQSPSNLSDGNVGNMAASLGLYSGRKDMPEKHLTPPGETCSGQESDQHESMRIDASEQEIVNRFISSVSVTQSTGSICANSKVDDSILAPSKIVSVEEEGYRNGVGCGQAEEHADIQHENMQSCSSEQEMVTLPIDSATVDENLNSTSSDSVEPGTPKCGKASVNLGTTDASELPTERMAPQFGAARDSEASTVRRLRSGKVFGTPSGGPMKRDHKKKKIQHATMVPNEGGTSTANLTSHENVSHTLILDSTCDSPFF
ncbi:hypothetical protein BAE44_0022220 [Dichanthelium oligosanthes]|uniref:SANTA domain-containing protein n=1 Tax=Dichanthelium oligosanthes TaxID=888268 RepID=A0A1E5UV59_9POAL|nr:hypothetical protein BAE44_0022220 [Dichanthelium oligosanthes]